MNNDERFQELKEKEINRLITPISYPKLGNFTFRVAARDCEGNPVPLIRTLGGNRYALEPKPGILSDDEILMYASESMAASEIRLKRGIATNSDKSVVNSHLTFFYSFSIGILFLVGLFSLITRNMIGIFLFLVILIIIVGSYIYLMHIKDYTEPKYKQTLKEEKPINEEKLSDGDELFLLFESKEKIAREMIERKFPAPQMTNTRFNAVLDNCKEVVESQVEILNALTPTERTKYEIDSRKKLIKQVIGKIDDLTNELILSEENSLEDVVEDMDELINSVKKYPS